MTTLPNSFQFSQSNLQDYLDCPRRFELKYILQYKWPAPISEPVIEFEHHIQQGIYFHQMVQQLLSGIALEQLSAPPDDLDLMMWWQNFINHPPYEEPGQLMLPEYRLSIPFLEFRLVAQLDLILMEPSGHVIIFDWKTTRSHPKRQSVLKRVQTRLYPMILAKAGLRHQTIDPNDLSMKYWYAGFPEKPDEIIYSHGLYQADQDYIHSLVQTILDTQPGLFELTPDLKKCAYCNYRSLCERGEKAGDLNGLNDETNLEDQDIDFDFKSTPEIAF